MTLPTTEFRILLLTRAERWLWCATPEVHWRVDYRRPGQGWRGLRLLDEAQAQRWCRVHSLVMPSRPGNTPATTPGSHQEPVSPPAETVRFTPYPSGGAWDRQARIAGEEP
jgi:hypothetical protein